MTIERELVTDSCKTCKKPVYADEGYYSVTGEHYDCHRRNEVEFTKSASRLDKLLVSKPKTTRRERGCGESVTKLKVMIIDALSKKFETDDVSDVVIHLTSPTWCRDIYDVHRFEGHATVDGQKRLFGSWATVKECLKFRSVKFDDDYPIMDLSPIFETRRSRKINI